MAGRIRLDGRDRCARCTILLEEIPDGIAVLTDGSRVCQDCVRMYGLRVVRWARPPREIVSDYRELAACYANEGLR